MGQIGSKAKILIKGYSTRFLEGVKGIALDNGSPVQQPKGQPTPLETGMTTQPDATTAPEFWLTRRMHDQANKGVWRR